MKCGGLTHKYLVAMQKKKVIILHVVHGFWSQVTSDPTSGELRTQKLSVENPEPFKVLP